VRLDPKLNYLCELAARAQRRTKSSFIEWAIENALQHVEIPGAPYGQGVGKSISEIQGLLWDVDEPDRVVRLARESPSLLTHEEQIIWKIISRNGFFWHGKHNEDGKWCWTYQHPAFSNIAESWADILKVAAGEMGERQLPQVADKDEPPPWSNNKAVAFDLDEECPF
jgi:hypothetical protein